MSLSSAKLTQPGHKHEKLGRILQDIRFHPQQDTNNPKVFTRGQMSRVEFRNAMHRNINEDRDVLNLLLVNDESHFHVTCFMYMRNMRYWASVNPREFHESQHASLRE
jgi:hypothetical protein